MSNRDSREILFASRPNGWPTLDNFTLASVEVGPPAEGQALVRNLYMSVDPYMRGRMKDGPSYISPFKLGKPLEGGAVGEVIESRSPAIAEGDIVLSMQGWREWFVADAAQLQVLDRSVEPPSLYLGVLGMPGMTAWAGMRLAELKPSDTVFVSAAAGAVGSVAGQLAKIKGCRVIGSAGSPEKVSMLTRELHFDAAINYKLGDLVKQIKAAAPDGIDVYFDNVGGDHLEAALTALRPHGRIIACGAISQYNDEQPTPGPSNLGLIIGKRLTMKGFIVSDYFGEMPAFIQEMTSYIKDGKVVFKETVVNGIEGAPQAFLDMLNGGNTGKMVVKLA